MDLIKASKTVSLHHAMKIEMFSKKLQEILDQEVVDWNKAVSITAEINESVMQLDDVVYTKFEEESQC